MDETAILAEIMKRFGRRSSRHVPVGVGDDAAVVRIGRQNVVLTVDTVVEGIDFDLRYFGWDDVGYKAISAAVSDLYACGAVPVAFLVTAGIPRGVGLSNLRTLLAGLGAAAAQHRAPIVGGDLSRAKKLFLDVTCVGRLLRKFIPRSGARPGDDIFLSGSLGASRAALGLFRRRHLVPPALRRAHLRPRADRRAGIALAREKQISAMMDVSDGLLIDLQRMCAAGGTCAAIALDRLPVDLPARKAFRSMGKDPFLEGAAGGEDYALLFAVRPPVPKRFYKNYFHIGCMIKGNPRPGLLYNMERRGLTPIDVKGFLHRF